MTKIQSLPGSSVVSAYIVSGQPHILLAHDQSPAWQSLYESYSEIREEIANTDADLILYFSTQWLSVLGYLFQADPEPTWTLVDHNWHELGSMPYQFRIDTDFASVYAREVGAMGHYVREVNYRGFPIDTGTVVAQKLLNPDNRLKAAMVSCNMYAEKQETLSIGQAAVRALEKAGKKAIVVLISNLSNRFEVKEIQPREDRISSLKDDEWNRKILDLLGEGRLEDVSEVAREFSRQANADMGFRGVWWLNGLCGKTNAFTGKVFDYQPVWGTGAALVGLYPQKPIRPVPGWMNDEADLVERMNRGATNVHPFPGEKAKREASSSLNTDSDSEQDPLKAFSDAFRSAVEGIGGRAKHMVEEATAEIERFVREQGWVDERENGAKMDQRGDGDDGSAFAGSEPSTEASGAAYPWQKDPAWRSKARQEMRAAFDRGESVQTWTDQSSGGVNASKAPPPVGPFPHARRQGDLLFLSGMGPRQAGTKEIPGTVKDENGRITGHDIEVQTRAVIENIRSVLESSGGALEDVLDVQVYLTDMARDFERFNKVYAEYFAAIGPTRTTVEVTSLPTPICVELKVIAKARD